MDGPPMETYKTLLKKTEGVLGEVITAVAKMSMDAAQQIERTMTLRHKMDVKQDSNGNVGVGGLLDMHWPGRGSGAAYNSDRGASYLMGIFCRLILAAWVYCKSC